MAFKCLSVHTESEGQRGGRGQQEGGLRFSCRVVCSCDFLTLVVVVKRREGGVKGRKPIFFPHKMVVAEEGGIREIKKK